jgi:hypothetical protein
MHPQASPEKLMRLAEAMNLEDTLEAWRTGKLLAKPERLR